MKRTRYISLIIALLSVLGIMAQQQQSQYALYNYRNDGDFNAWLNIDVDSITYSNIGLDSIEYDNIVTQEVWTPDSCYRIPIEAIDSIGFRAPVPEFKEGIFHITEEHLPYAADADSLSVTFDSSIPTSMLPAVGQIVISDVYEEPFEDGFAGRVESVDFLEGKYVIQCSEVKITDIFSKLILVGKGVSVSDAEPANDARRKSWSWWNDPAFTVEGQGIYSVKLPTTLDLTLLSGVCSVKSKNPELTVSYYLYLDDVIYSFSADAYLNHKDLSFQIAFKLSDFLKIGNTVSEHMTNFILGKIDEEEAEEKWYEHEFDDIKLKVPFQAGPVNFTFELAPIFKLDGDVEVDVINKTSARQHLGFKSSGYTATLMASPFLSLALSDLNYNYVQDPTRVQQLTMKAEGSATMGISLQLKANVISKNLLHAAIGAEYDRKASATLQFNLYDTENPISGLYDVIKDSKVKVEDYVKIKGEIGVSPLKLLTLKGSFKIPIKTWGEYYMVPHFTKPELPPYKNSPWNFSKPLSLYSAVSKDILLGCKPGLRIEDSNGNYVKQYTSTDEYKYEAAWVHTPLEIDISDLTPNKTYRCYPTFSMLGLDPFVVMPYNEFTIPQNLSVSPQSISMPVGMEYIIEIRDGWDTFAVVMEEGEDVVSILHDEETDARHIKVKGVKEGNASLKIEDRRSGQVVHVPITITYAMTLVTSITLSQTTLSLQEGDTQSLTATVLPEDADNRNVAWESGDEGVATVSADGLVTAVSKGTCVITCSATDGSGVKAECQVTVTSGTIPDPGNHAWVDLGLPSGTLWATCNVGANSPEEYGDYFAWGETEPKNEYNWSTYKYCNGSARTMTKYCTSSRNGDNGFTDGLTELLPEDDAATANWGSGWQMPSLAQMDELVNSSFTTTEWTTLNGKNGRKITSKNNGNTIFLPAAGRYGGTNLYYADSIGDYWSRSLYTINEWPDYSGSFPAYMLNFKSEEIMSSYNLRSAGHNVRPVHIPIQPRVTSIVLNVTSLNLHPNETYELIATVLPEDPDNKLVAWESSNESVATVSAEGLVTAVSKGSCSIICYATDGSGVKAECQVTVTPDPGNHEWVDLGLPSGTLWATCNVGADSPEETGDYLGWGETEPKEDYSWYAYTGPITGSTEDELSPLYLYDVAYIKWGSKWQIPSEAQLNELFFNDDYITKEYTQVNSVKGYKITSKSNGNSIFLPVTGYHDATMYGENLGGYYWSHSPSPDNYKCARCLYFYCGGLWSWGFSSKLRDFGMCVRPVRVQNSTSPTLVTYISLKETLLNLLQGDTYALLANVIPVDAENRNVTWSSSNSNIATVDQTGKVTAKSAGTCVITCSTTDGSGVKAECQVIVTSVGHSCSDSHHPHAIDLGLPSGTKWCCCNVGASSPEEYGRKFGWDDQYYFPGDDATMVIWNAPWHLPTLDQINELLDNCTRVWTTLNGVNGIFVTGPSGGRIFLPAEGDYGDYWSSSVSSECNGCTYDMYFNSDTWGCGDIYGLSYIRLPFRFVRQ